jgi:hypothetical protein
MVLPTENHESLFFFAIIQTRNSITNRKHELIYYATRWRGGFYIRLQERWKTEKIWFINFISSVKCEKNAITEFH